MNSYTVEHKVLSGETIENVTRYNMAMKRIKNYRKMSMPYWYSQPYNILTSISGSDNPALPAENEWRWQTLIEPMRVNKSTVKFCCFDYGASSILWENANLGGSTMRGSFSVLLRQAIAKEYPRARPTGTATAFPIWRYLQPGLSHVNIYDTDWTIASTKYYVLFCT
jgi:hypothetical protein